MAILKKDCFGVFYANYLHLEDSFLKLFLNLTEREVNFVLMYYGFLDRKYSIKEIAKVMRVSPERVLMLRNHALNKMRKYCNSGFLTYMPTAMIGYEKVKSLIDYRGILIKEIDEYLHKKTRTNHYLDHILLKAKTWFCYDDNAYNYVLKSIDDLELSVRAWNCLKRAGINDLYSLIKMSEEDLKNVGNIGTKAFVEIQEKLKKYVSGFQDTTVANLLSLDLYTSGNYKKIHIPLMDKSCIGEYVYEMVLEYK